MEGKKKILLFGVKSTGPSGPIQKNSETKQCAVTRTGETLMDTSEGPDPPIGVSERTTSGSAV